MARKTSGIRKQRRASVGVGKARHGETPRVVRPVQSAQSFGRSELLIAAGLAVATLAVYGQVISHQFINFDDDIYIRDNAMVNGGFSFKGNAWGFTTFSSGN